MFRLQSVKEFCTIFSGTPVGDCYRIKPSTNGFGSEGMGSALLRSIIEGMLPSVGEVGEPMLGRWYPLLSTAHCGQRLAKIGVVYDPELHAIHLDARVTGSKEHHCLYGEKAIQHFLEALKNNEATLERSRLRKQRTAVAAL